MAKMALKIHVPPFSTGSPGPMTAENAALQCADHDLPWIYGGFQAIFASKLPKTAQKTCFSKIYIGGTLCAERERAEDSQKFLKY